jgi:S-adenosyl-L-methionine hydrolase (adenosine-forming)
MGLTLCGMSAVSPIVTLTSDFGSSDSYVAAMKAAILRQCPGAMLIDVTHQIAAYDILAASFAVERAIAAFDAGAIHLAVVDPGVGTNRRLLIAEINGQLLVCPDNGLLTWAWRRAAAQRAHELTWRAQKTSATFHGRDILAPAAGKLAAGQALATIARPISDPLLLPIAPAAKLSEAQIIHIDHFGNATTNIGQELLRGGLSVRIRGKDIGSVRVTYGDVQRGSPLALIGSSGLLEIAVNQGSAANVLSLHVGDEVHIL